MVSFKHAFFFRFFLLILVYLWEKVQYLIPSFNIQFGVSTIFGHMHVWRIWTRLKQCQTHSTIWSDYTESEWTIKMAHIQKPCQYVKFLWNLCITIQTVELLNLSFSGSLFGWTVCIVLKAWFFKPSLHHPQLKATIKKHLTKILI